MTAAPAIVHQRAEGSIRLRTGHGGVERLRESGAAKVRLPRGSGEAILINTGGGLAGGDRFAFDIAVAEGAALNVTSQAAERVYRSLGTAAEVAVKLDVEGGARLAWLPQETILFNGAMLTRRIDATLGEGARLLAVESAILGRTASRETVRHAVFRDRWRVSGGGRLIHAEDLAFDGAPPATAATLGGACAFATILLVACEAESLLDPVRAAIGGKGGASAWSGKLVARLAARDGLELRKALIPALSLLGGGGVLPKVWSQ